MRNAIFVLIVLGLGPIVAAQDAERPPNIIIVLVDDLGWTDLTCQGSTYYETPNIDRLAAKGMRFTDAYAACAVCSPTRAAVMTGRYPARVGVTDWIRARFQRGGRGTPEENPTAYVGGPGRKLLCPPNPFWLESDEVTIAEALRSRGYVSAHIGKWHLGDDAWYPQEQGFAENHGGCDYGQPPSYFDPYANRRLTGIPHLAPKKTGQYLTDREADEAVSFIERNRERPFFLHLAHYAVHTPIQARQDLTERYREKKNESRQKNARYAAMVHSVDDAMGRVLIALDRAGIADRTLIIFTSDNGGLLGPTHNAPLRSGKGFPYEGGIRVPLIMRWPGVVPEGSTSSEPVTSVDYFPTALAAAGVPPASHEIDGTSLVEHLRSGGRSALGRDAIFWHFPHYRGRVTPYSIVRAGRWKLLKRYEGPTYELYDLEADLGETKNLAGAMPDRVRELESHLARHLASVGAKLPRKNPGYSPPEPEKRDPTLPRVLILGDSISMGYMQSVKNRLKGKAEVYRPMHRPGRAENCQGTRHGVKRIDAWLAADGGRWDVIHFNFGLHDLKRVQPDSGKNSNDPQHPYQSPPEVYKRQLTEIVGKLEKTGAKLIFATTTPVPKGVRPYRDVKDPGIYNAIALEIMKARKIEVNDLYAFALERLDRIQQPANVHFSRRGSQTLGGEVARVLRRALAARKR